jgi:hypothetical protein
MPSLQARIDELYQLPLDEFTSARNALAKTLSGDAKRQVASLTKPTRALWGVNQLYWRAPATYKALVDAAEKLRAAHRAVLEGKKADLRNAERLHRHTLERAVAATSDLLAQSGDPPSEAVLATARRVLAGLPSGDHAGRFTEEPPPAGFSLLEGVALKAQPIREPAPRAKLANNVPDREAALRARQQSAAEERRRRKAEELEKKAEAVRRREEARARLALDRARRAEVRAIERRKAAEEKLAALTRDE